MVTSFVPSMVACLSDFCFFGAIQLSTPRIFQGRPLNCKVCIINNQTGYHLWALHSRPLQRHIKSDRWIHWWLDNDIHNNLNICQKWCINKIYSEIKIDICIIYICHMLCLKKHLEYDLHLRRSFVRFSRIISRHAHREPLQTLRTRLV